MSKVLLVLLRVEARGVGRNLLPMGLLLAAGLAGPALAVRWEEGNLALGTAALTGFGGERVGATTSYLRELFSWWWVAVAAAYLLPVVLLPTAASFSRDQILWLRLTPCSAREVAVGRAGRVLASTAALASLALPAGAFLAAYHDLPPGLLLATAAALPAHALLAGGLVLIAGPRIPLAATRALFAFVAFLAPVISFLAFVALRPHLDPSFGRWWPYVVPFAPPLDEASQHVLVSVGLGVLFLIMSVLLQPAARAARA
jgi:hypothetical protein